MRHFLRQLFGLSPIEGEQRSLLVDFWRSTLGVFIALRLADVLNAVTGLYIIPTKLAPEVLGAILPLMQVGAVLAMPVTVFTLVFSRHLCAYSCAGDSIRVRGLLRDALIATALTLVGALTLTMALTPWLCTFLRVPYSSVGYLAVSYGLIAAFTPMAWSALQALKRFGAISTGALLAAPIRLIAMALLLPLIGLPGYFIGQSLAPLTMLVVALITLAPLLRQSREAPFMAWRKDLKPMLRYAGCIAAGVLAAALQGAVITFVIRHRLSSDHSGAYYLISRFAEIATYSGTTLATVLFPYAIEARHRGLSSNAFRTSVMGLILLIGIALAAVLYWALPLLAPILPLLTTAANAPLAAAYLTLITTLNAASTLHFTHTAAHDRFTYLYFVLPLTLLLSCALLLMPIHSLMPLLHLLFVAASLQFLGCLIDAAFAKKRP